jgi:hypothetical protein
MPTAVLLIAHPTTAEPVAEVLRERLDIAVEVAPNRRSGLASLRRHEYALILLEEGAALLEINFVLSATERILRQVRSALARRAHDHAQARVAVARSLHGELNSTLAGLLLESQLALREAQPEQQPKLRQVVALASGLRDRLRA